VDARREVVTELVREQYRGERSRELRAVHDAIVDAARFTFVRNDEHARDGREKEPDVERPIRFYGRRIFSGARP
jgi:hypothetical protein